MDRKGGPRASPSPSFFVLSVKSLNPLFIHCLKPFSWRTARPLSGVPDYVAQAGKEALLRAPTCGGISDAAREVATSSAETAERSADEDGPDKAVEAAAGYERSEDEEEEVEHESDPYGGDDRRPLELEGVPPPGKDANTDEESDGGGDDEAPATPQAPPGARVDREEGSDGRSPDGEESDGARPCESAAALDIDAMATRIRALEAEPASKADQRENIGKNIFGVSDGAQTFLNYGAAILALIYWQLADSAFPIAFVNTTVFLLCLMLFLLKSTGLCSGAWVLIRIPQTNLKYQYDKVHVRTQEERVTNNHYMELEGQVPACLNSEIVKIGGLES